MVSFHEKWLTMDALCHAKFASHHCWFVFFLSRVSMLTRDIDIANLSVRPSVRYVPVSDENGLTYRHSFFSIQ